jgi:hypothetical protein
MVWGLFMQIFPLCRPHRKNVDGLLLGTLLVRGLWDNWLRSGVHFPSCFSSVCDFSSILLEVASIEALINQLVNRYVENCEVNLCSCSSQWEYSCNLCLRSNTSLAIVSRIQWFLMDCIWSTFYVEIGLEMLRFLLFGRLYKLTLINTKYGVWFLIMCSEF